MIAGRLRWRDRRRARPPGQARAGRVRLRHGTLLLTEAGSKKRASLHVVRGDARRWPTHDPRRPRAARRRPATQFREALPRENHTLKRALTDPRLFSGIGNAYSDEILHAARLSPLKLTRR